MENRGTFGLVWFSNKIIFDMKYSHRNIVLEMKM